MGKAISTSAFSVVVKYGDKEIAKRRINLILGLMWLPYLRRSSCSFRIYTKAVAKVVVSAVPDQERKRAKVIHSTLSIQLLS